MKPSEFHAMTAPDQIAREWEPTDAELHELFWSERSLRELAQPLAAAPVITVRRVAALEQRQRQEAEARRFLQTGEALSSIGAMARDVSTRLETARRQQDLLAQNAAVASSLASFADLPTVHVELQAGGDWVRVPDTFRSRAAAEAYCQRMRAVQPHVQWRVEDEAP